VKPDNEIGRKLMHSVSALPKIDPASLEKMFNNNLQDLLLVVYLANLTRTQLALSEKLQKAI
jgi:translation initiation factor 3 subunit F